jgi:hypothetical protein
MITFLLSGFWHGASYNFIIWGFLHGALLVVEKILLKVFPKFKGFSLIIFISVILCWVPFRAADLAQTVAAWSPLFSFNFIIEKFIYPLSIHNQLFLIPLALFVVIEFWINKLTFAEKVMKIPKAIRWVLYYTLILCILVFGDFNNAPTFIYFQF